MIKKLFILVCLSFIYFGCRNLPVPPIDDNSDCFGILFDLYLPLKVQNEQGENLLNNKYVKDSIQLYYVFSDGCAVLCEYKYEPEKKGFHLYDDIIEIGTSPDFFHTHNGQYYDAGIVVDEPCLMYIKWNSQDTDTLQTTFVHLRPIKEKSLNGYCEWNVYDKVYLNGNLIVSSWEDNRAKMSQGIYPTIVKE